LRGWGVGALPVDILDLQTALEVTAEMSGIATKAAIGCLKCEDINPSEVEISIVFVDDVYIAELNRRVQRDSESH